MKTLYTSTRDLLHFMAGNKNSELQKVVLVTLDSDVRLLGFVTCEDVSLGSQTNLWLFTYPRPTKLVALQCTCRKSAASFGHKP